MSLRVNTNISAINTQRQLSNNNSAHAKSLERLSSGLKINRGADAPAQLQISERLRAQSSGLRQAIDNSEMGVSLMQTAEAALDEVSRALINARQVAVHAANDATNDPTMLEADQQELENIIATVNRIAKNTQYGTKVLLDGSKAGNGVAVGKNLEFVSGGPKAQTSGANGYKVEITQVSTRNTHRGQELLTQELIDQGEQITITEGGRSMNFKTMKGDSVEQTLNKLQASIDDANLNVKLIRPDATKTKNTDPQLITVQHKEFGSEHKFTVASSTKGLLSSESNISDTIANGLDVAGEINGEQAKGVGQILTGSEGSTSVEGISVRYTAENPLDDSLLVVGKDGQPVVGKDGKPVMQASVGSRHPDSDGNPYRKNSEDSLGEVGTVTFAQNSLTFQTGANAGQTTKISMKSMRASELANGVTNDSDFKSLSDVNVTKDPQSAQDTIRILDKAIEEVAASRGDLGAFQKNNLESNLNYLRIASENVDSSESIIRDANVAEEMATLTRNQIMSQTSMAMMAQANQKQQSVMQLIG